MGKLRMLCLFLTLALLCSGCGGQAGTVGPAPQETGAPTVPAETVPPATTPADGDPGDVTCKGTYTADALDRNTVVAKVGDYELTNEQLQVWYWMEVSARQQEIWRDAAPNWSAPLDTQNCPIDGVNSWQQFFLKRALNTWHSVCALELHAREVPLPTEAAYKPNLDNHQKYMTGMPATQYLYGYQTLFAPNSMHEAYLNALPETLAQLAQEKGFGTLEEMASALGVSAGAVEEVVRLYNYSYAYYTSLSYYTDMIAQQKAQAKAEAETAAKAAQEAAAQETQPEAAEETIPAPPEPVSTEPRVTVRQILLVPEDAAVAADGTLTCTEEQWQAAEKEAEELYKQWKKRYLGGESAFADIARKNSDDEASGLDGGELRNIRPGQLIEDLDAWCFDEARQPGEIGTVRSPYGVHLLYFSGSTDAAVLKAEESRKVQILQEILEEARTRYPAQITYSAVELGTGEPVFSLSDALYPDVAHERFPEVPLYLQQDYLGTKFGGQNIVTHGCGITTMSMLASYMADEELTPPIMCARYYRYGSVSGTDGMIFDNESAGMGFYLREKTYDYDVAKAGLQEGQIVISVQHKGYWTRGGHYILLETIDDEGMIQVRDSNIYNYSRVAAHAEDRHTWGSIIGAGDGYWVFEDKITRIPLCSRCGEGEGASPVLSGEYICKKCGPALLRRDSYLSLCGQ